MQKQNTNPQFTFVTPIAAFDNVVKQYFQERSELSEDYSLPPVLHSEIVIPYDGKNDELQVHIDIANTNSQTYSFNPDLTAWLAIFECFGPEANYHHAFVAFAASHRATICEHGYRRVSIRPRKARYFRGRIVENKKFEAMINSFFDK